MKKINEKDIKRFEKNINNLKKIMDDIKKYQPNACLVCFPTAPSLSIVINDRDELVDDLYDCEEVVSVMIDCTSCS